MPETVSICLAGGSGLVGSAVLKASLGSHRVHHIHHLCRKPLSISHQKLRQHCHPHLGLPVMDEPNAKVQVQVGIIALGTTLKKAGSRAKLRAIDVDLVLQVATTMKSHGVAHLLVVSSIGASVKAMSHYLRCKGDMEQGLIELGFPYLDIMQPGPLKGLRDEIRRDEVWLQRAMACIAPVMIGPLANYQPINGNEIAQAMLALIDLRQQQAMSATNKQGVVARFNRQQILKLINLA
ncbi:nucleoside-diphosphate sugar epimerase [Motilimonas pumila]|uniref:Nucleoside-diphosphate sugar epimerase n=1 Tax=Motilimonas pumila TaxID=2303987 RepID=A0A418YKT9_9GAMM|nr:nucleoside-diphosphate sugar epimerase [Motilimonas pumila]RJG51598.1 nucleoside-diphosphate sugar epimerase [Motilimonas pumila]